MKTTTATSLVADADRVLRLAADQAIASPTGPLPAGRRLLQLSILAGAFYGLSMGLYAALREDVPAWWFPLFTVALKVPALFLLTPLVTVPSLYVFSVLSGSRVGMRQLFRLLVMKVAITTLVLASLGPVTVFFTLSTESQPFMVLLNVVFFCAAWLVGLLYLARALARRIERPATSTWPRGAPVRSPEDVLGPPELPGSQRATGEGHDDEGKAPSATPGTSQSSETTAPPQISEAPIVSVRNQREGRVPLSGSLKVWLLIHVVVAMQMSWILRPFIGIPGEEFVLFEPRGSSFLAGFLDTISKLFGGP